jgi:V8-like Glu-specific endopeptidase
MRSAWTWFVVAAIVAVVALYAPLPLGAQTPPSGVVRGPGLATPAAIRAYWTAGRLNAARPRELPARVRPPVGGPATPLTGIGTFTEGNEPGRAPGVPRRLPEALRGEATPLSHTAFTYPYPFNRYQVFPITVTPFAVYQNFPFRTIGKLFFTLAGVNYVCSASSVTSGSGGNQSLVWTAGHCVHEGGPGGTFATNVLFVPAYRDGAQPFGSWTAHMLFTSAGWANNSNLRVDFGVIVVNRRSSDGATLGSVVGTLGIATGVTDHQHYHVFGYPAARQTVWPGTAFNGNRMWGCQSSAARRVTEEPGSGPAPVAVGCDMTGGSSGGPWIMGLNDGYSMGWHVNGGFLNGNVSYRYSNEPRALNGPYFGSEAFDLWNAARTAPVP